MLGHFACLGISHRHAPVAVREALCLSSAAKSKLHERASRFRGFALLSTCNRIEFYLDRDREDTRPVREAVTDVLPPDHAGVLSAVSAGVYELTGLDAARHVARVAAGLDSQVLGESQIQGQVQDCLRTSEAHDRDSALLSLVFQAGLKAGVRVRQETGLARNPASIASVAVDLAQNRAGDLGSQRVAVLGAGEMGRLTAKILRKTGTKRLIIVNRTRSRAEEVAKTSGAEAYPLSALTEVLPTVDVVFCTMRGEGILLDEGHLEKRDGPLLIMDLAVPRNVAPSVQQISGVQLFDIDGLRSGIDESLTLRRAEVPKAEAIVKEEMDVLEGQVRALTVEPLIRTLRRRAEAIRQQELKRALSNLNGLGAEEKACLQKFSLTLVNRILHEPTTRLRERATTDGAGQETELIRALFSL